MKNLLTIFLLNGKLYEYWNVKNFQTQQNGVCVFTIGNDTRCFNSSLSVGMQIKFKGDFIYEDYEAKNI